MGDSLQSTHERLLGMSGKLPLARVLQMTLDDAEQLTGSQLGFFHTVDADESMIALKTFSTATVERWCTITDAPTHYRVEEAGVWADSLRERQPVIHNDLATVPGRRGWPEGHPEIVRELVVPVFREDRVCAIVGVGNKPEPYTDADRAVIEQLANDMWLIIEYQQAKDALRARVSNDRMLAEKSHELMLAESRDDVFRVMSDFFSELLPGTVVVAHEMSPDHGGRLRVRWILGADESTVEKVQQLMGVAYLSQDHVVSGKTLESLTQARLGIVPGRLSDMLLEQLPGAQGDAIELLLGTSEVHVIGIADEHTSYGTVHMLAPDGSPRPPRRVIEAFVHQCFLAIARADATELLRQSERRYALAFRTSPDAVNINRMSDGLYIDVNDAFLKIMGYGRDEVIGASSLTLNVWTHAEDRARMVETLKREGEVVNFEASFTRKDGSVLTGLMSARPIVVEGEPCILSMTRDISDRKVVEQQVRTYAEQLSELAEKVVSAESYERRRLAEELHDRVSQALAVARMHLDQAAGSPEDMQESVAAAKRLLADAISESRAITSELAPTVLYELGLSAAVQWQAEDIEAATGLRIHTDIEVEACGMSDTAKEVVLRASRELLINTVKHARVQEAWLSLHQQGDCVEMAVRDKGVGFDSDEVSSPSTAGSGFGLFSLRQRVSWLGGTLDVRASRGAGTTVTIRIPCDESAS